MTDAEMVQALIRERDGLIQAVAQMAAEIAALHVRAAAGVVRAEDQ